MITLPIWLFVLCLLLGFPLVIIIFTYIGVIGYIIFKIGIEVLKSIKWVNYYETSKRNNKMGRYKALF